MKINLINVQDTLKWVLGRPLAFDGFYYADTLRIFTLLRIFNPLSRNNSKICEIMAILVCYIINAFKPLTSNLLRDFGW